MLFPLYYVVLVAIIWFLFYWIVGGAFFAVVAVFRLGSFKKAQFSCLYTLVAAGLAAVSAYLGVRSGGEEALYCLNHVSQYDGFIAFFGCAIVPLMLSFIAGAAVMLTIGFAIFLLSSRREGAYDLPEESPDEMTEEQKAETVKPIPPSSPLEH